MKFLLFGCFGLGIGLILGFFALRILTRIPGFKLRLMYWFNLNQVIFPRGCKPIVWHGRLIESKHKQQP